MNDAKLDADRPKTNLYAWGDNSYGQLGIGRTDQFIVEPQPVIFFDAKDRQIVSVACGFSKTLFLTTDGVVYQCGLSAGDTPKSIDPLTTYHHVVSIAAGREHFLALTDSGQVFSWGSPQNNALGRDYQLYENGYVADHTHEFPRIIKKLADAFVIQISTFAEHCLALTDCGELYAWGANSFGQCGVGHHNPVEYPTLLASITGVPIARIACGATHSALITKSAAFWSWGDNRCGQLGKPETEFNVAEYPVNVRAMRDQRLAHVACGENFTVLLSQDGRVLSFGDNSYGQLGHGEEVVKQSTPRPFRTTGAVMQLVAGRRHVLTTIKASSSSTTTNEFSVNSMGANSRGECGTIITTSNGRSSVQSKVFQAIRIATFPDRNQHSIREIFAGGSHSFILTSQQPSDSIVDFRQPLLERYPPILCVDRHFLHQCTEYGKRDSDVSSMDENVSSCYVKVEKIFSSLACLNASFLTDTHRPCSSTNSGLVEITKLRENATKLLATRFSDIIRQQLSQHILSGDALKSNPPDVESLRVMILLPALLCPSTQAPSIEFIQLYLVPFARSSVALDNQPEKVYKQWLLALGSDFLFYVHLWRDTITRILEHPQLSRVIRDMEQSMRVILDEYAFLFYVSRQMRRKVPVQEFYVPAVNNKINLAQDYVAWLQSPANTDGVNQHQHDLMKQQRPKNLAVERSLIFCNYPFIFDGSGKVELLRADSYIQKQQAARQGLQVTMMNAIFHGSNVISMENQFLNILVNRRDLVIQSLAQLGQATELDLKKPLRVQFVGEEAEDAGGVRKEYFMLLMKELLDPKYGMFTEYEETRTIWFNEASFEDESMFFLVGACCGLAIYNEVIIHVNFPLPLYCKLLNVPVGLNDLAYLSPLLHRNLTELLDYDGDDVEDVFSLTFSLTRDRFGAMETVELCPDGAKKNVTKANKAEYVTLYADYVLNKGIEKQYVGFSRGFNKVAGTKMLKLFAPDELMSMVCGSEQYDWHALEKSAEYKGNYNKQHQVIEWFWDVFHNDLDEEQKRKFLLYLTGCDRVPLQGMQQIKIFIQPVQAEEHLPVAHTCFNLLDLPVYTSREKLRRKLLYVIDHTQGFGLV